MGQIIQEMSASAHDTRDSISLISYARCRSWFIYLQ